LDPRERIVCALDVDTTHAALDLVHRLKDHVGIFKVGLELATSAGVEVLGQIHAAGVARIFYDAKLMDIPNTVAGAIRAIVRLKAWCVTVHVTGGTAMMQAAVEAARYAAENTGLTRPKILGVTLLTSIGEETLRDQLQCRLPLPEYVSHLARLAYEAGCDGVITSPQEIEAVRRVVRNPEFLVITPGVRLRGADVGDQARVMTPAEAVRSGADYLVIGRPIIAAPDPVAAAKQIAAEIADV
jgi:orotidine-5'-phosphate decarboxylase